MIKKLALLIILVPLLQGCEFFRKLDKSETSNANVKKEDIKVESGDTTKVKTSSTNEWERWTFVPRDTNITNIYIPKQEPVRPIIYERGSGTKDEQIDWGKFHNMQQALLDSIRATQTTKKTETEASFFSPMVILMIGITLFIVLVFAVLILYIFSKLKNKLTL